MNNPKVIALSGDEFIKPGEPIPEIVEILGEFLAKAKDGQIVAVCIVALDKELRPEIVSYEHIGRMSLAGALGWATSLLYKKIDSECH